ncbi:DUF3048 family protein [Kribbella voronezhensis]|uniref:DUF3048 family protein n=1 Tax=Kribbella voronezhensis TaxID=2512212 RepID=A0A4R7SWV7_9ACTN|nr:DUF3048 domain-containing protein [Kribbella voronezhensis]TDU83842.1 DUF3048 family protein [Kribbella voronezhensis]
MRMSKFFASTRARVGLAAVAIAAVLLGVGWYVVRDGSSTGPSGAPPTTASAPVDDSSPAGDGAVNMDGRAPLTGLPVTKALNHPAVTVKVSNTPDAHPQRGLGSADIVFVEPITGATTRLAAIFHSQLPPQVGPVRSLRPMDAPLISPTKGVIANTMADHWVQQYIDRVAGLANLGTLRVPSGTYFIDRTRRAPNHVFAQPARLLELTDRVAPPPPYFSYAGDVAHSSPLSSGRTATSVTVGYGGSATATWRYDGASGRWLRAEKWAAHRLEDGNQVSAQNVIVLHAQRDLSFPQAKSSMTILDLTDASGSLQLFTGGKVVDGHWTKAGVDRPFTFTTTTGKALLLAPGTTWVECALPGMPIQTAAS